MSPTAIVLVEPSLPENVGAVARAMANFGLADLRLVAPETPPDHPRAVAAATHGAAVLAGARVYATLGDALHDRRAVWATTARPKEVPVPALGPRALGAALRAAEAQEAAPAVIFGPERTGLRYEHVAHATTGLVHIPTDAACPALNLAQAVALVSWERFSADEAAHRGVTPAHTPAPHAAFDAWFDAFTAAINRVGYLSEPALRVRALRNLRAALQRAGFSEAELNTLRGVVRALAER